MDLEKELTKLERYLIRHSRETLIQELKSLSNDQRRNRLMKQAVHEQEIFDTKDKESQKEEIQNAKTMLREFNALYNEQLKLNRKIARYIHLLIEDSGKV
jgi:hypothetical protein